jgi:hypothetical protein
MSYASPSRSVLSRFRSYLPQPSRFLVTPQLLTRVQPLPVGKGLSRARLLTCLLAPLTSRMPISPSWRAAPAMSRRMHAREPRTLQAGWP